MPKSHTTESSPKARKSRKGPNGQSLADRAYERLEELIVTLKLQPGTILTEADLIRRIGIGRTPMREALQRLEAFHLVTPLPRHGIMISEVDVADHMTLLETRRVIDRLIASRAARRATEEQREALHHHAAEILLTSTSGNLEAFMRLDHECDEVLEEATRNPSAVQAAGPLHIQSRRFWYAFHQKADFPRAARLHHNLLLAVAQGNGPEAEVASDRLIDYLEEFTRSTFEP
jgi:DNA-binding GntR family transcriptional regulator